MNRVGVLAICYGSRGTAIIDALCRSVKYSVELYIIDKNQLFWQYILTTIKTCKKILFFESVF